MIDLDTFLALETEVWDALTTGDTTRDMALLAPDFLGVYSTGFSDRAGHVGQLQNGPSVEAYAISQARVMGLGPGRVLLAYRAEYTRTGSQTPEAMYVSSIWEERAGAWVNTFSQDTNAADPAPV